VEGLGEFSEFTEPEKVHGGRTPEAQIYLVDHKFVDDTSDYSDTLVNPDSESDSELEDLKNNHEVNNFI